MTGRDANHSWSSAVLLGAALVVASLIGMRSYAPGILFLPLIADTDWSRVEVSLAVTVQTFMNMIALFAVGWLGARLSSRSIILITTLLGSVGFVLCGFVQSVWHLVIALGIFAGIGGGGASLVSVVALTSRAFVKQRTMAIGVVQSGISIGGILGPVLLVPVIHTIGWRDSFVLVGLLLGLITLLMLPLLNPRATESDGAPKGNAETTVWTVRRSLLTPVYWILYLQFLLLMTGWYIIVTHFYLFATDQSLPVGVAATAIIWVAGASIPGRFLLAPLADRFGDRVIFVLSFVLMTIGFVLLLGHASELKVQVFGIVFGLACGMCLPLFPKLLQHYYGFPLLKQLYAIQFTASNVAGMTGPVLAGWIFDTTGSYAIVFRLLAYGSAAMAIAALWLRAPAPVARFVERAVPHIASSSRQSTWQSRL
jgi:MFS family permease